MNCTCVCVLVHCRCSERGGRSVDCATREGPASKSEHHLVGCMGRFTWALVVAVYSASS